MTITTAKKPNQKLVYDLVDGIRDRLETTYGPHKSARREIEYVMYAALLIVDEATHHQSDMERIESFRRAAAMFDDLAQIHYVDPIKGA